jgi:predicted N-acetyltransferase YhbS
VRSLFLALITPAGTGPRQARRALALGPLAVPPDRQRRGVGPALMHAVPGAAEALSEPLVAVPGDRRCYARFGLQPTGACGIVPVVPWWRPRVQIRALTAYVPSVHGRVTCPQPFSPAAKRRGPGREIRSCPLIALLARIGLFPRVQAP